jgi:L-amino acid N-acyltransferase YncA
VSEHPGDDIADWPTVERIYAAGIATGHATFETQPPTWEQFEHSKLADQRLVAVDDHGRVTGWVAASAAPERRVYAGVVEHSVYVHPDHQGRGIGLVLLEATAVRRCSGLDGESAGIGHGVPTPPAAIGTPS